MAVKGMLKAWRHKRREERQLRDLVAGSDYRFQVHYGKSDTNLVAELCTRYGSDKGEVGDASSPRGWAAHTYADFYMRLFAHCRSSVKRVFECGIGTNNPDLVSSMGAQGKPGASLRVWRDYFPNASVYGADIDRDILFQEDRISTFYIDQLDPEAIATFWKAVGVNDFDLMVDDGLHTFEAGCSLFTHSIDRLSQAGIYVIEDVGLNDLLRYQEFFSTSDFVVDYVTLFRPKTLLRDNNLVVVRRP